MIKNISKLISKIYFYLYLIKKSLFGGHVKFYSLCGEDLVLSHFINKNKEYKGFYVDIGAYHPKKFSNTFFFYKRGWRGINIDAEPGSMKNFNKQRKRDINLEIGISKENGEKKFYIFEESAYNTFSKEVAELRFSQKIPLKEKKIVAQSKLEKILDKYLPDKQKIDFMSIDVEGLDMDVLESNNWSKYTPNFILIESSDFDVDNVNNSKIYTFLKERGYNLVSIIDSTLLFKNVSLKD